MRRLSVFLCFATFLVCSGVARKGVAGPDSTTEAKSIEVVLFDVDSKLKLRTAEYINSARKGLTSIESCKCLKAEPQFITNISGLEERTTEISKWLMKEKKTNPERIVDTLAQRYKSLADNFTSDTISKALHARYTAEMLAISDNAKKDLIHGNQDKNESTEGHQFKQFVRDNGIAMLGMLFTATLAVAWIIWGKNRSRLNTKKIRHEAPSDMGAASAVTNHSAILEHVARLDNRLSELELRMPSLENRLRELESKPYIETGRMPESARLQEKDNEAWNTVVNDSLAFPILYARVVDVGDGFSVDGLSNVKEDSSIFEINRTTAVDATFKVTDSFRAQQIALSDPFSYLSESCDYVVEPNSDRIATQQPGTLVLKHNKWAIVNKAKIAFERI